MPHEELDQKAARGVDLQQLVDEAFILAQSEDMPSAIAKMQAACDCEGAKGSTHEMLAQLLLEGDRPQEAALAAQDALDLGDQVGLVTHERDGMHRFI